MSDSRVLERAMGRLQRHPIGAVCPASHARDREHSIHRFVERVSAERRLRVDDVDVAGCGPFGDDIDIRVSARPNPVA
jgi:hypothetical protein